MLMDIYGVMHWPAPSRASAAVSTSSSWPRMLFYTAVAFQTDMRQTDTDRQIPERGSNSRQ